MDLIDGNTASEQSEAVNASETSSGSIRDIMSTVFDELESGASDASSSEAKGGGERQVADTSEAQLAKAADEGGEQQARADKEAKEADAAASMLKAPHHWPEDRKAAFGLASEDIKQAWLAQSKDVEAGLTRKAQEAAELRKFNDQVRSHFTADHRAQMQKAGITDEGAAVAHLLKLQDLSTRDPVGYVRAVMQHTGLNPQQLFEGLQKPQSAGDPRYDALLGKISGLEQSITARQEREQAAAAENAQGMIDSFTSSKGADGALLHPHFERVELDLVDILQHHPTIAAMPAGDAKLKAAYEEAVWRNPDVRAELIAAKKATSTADADAEAEHARKAESAARARAAKGAKPKPGSNSDAATAPKGLRGIMEDAARTLGI